MYGLHIKNVKKHIIKFNKYVAYFLSFVSGLLYIGFVIYTLTIGSYDVLPIIIFAISIVLVQILENILGISIKNNASIKQTVESHLQATCSAI